MSSATTNHLSDPSSASSILPEEVDAFNLCLQNKKKLRTLEELEHLLDVRLEALELLLPEILHAVDYVKRLECEGS